VPLEIRPARPDEHGPLGELTASTYLAEGLSDEDYAAKLRDVASRAAEADVLVAVLDGQLAGGVTVVTHGGSYAEGQPAGVAVIRALVVAPFARGKGAGDALVQACIAKAREDGCSLLRLSTQDIMTAAQALYVRHGFVRTPEDDWRPTPELLLRTYALVLRYCGHCGEPGTHPDCERTLALEPPRYCTACKRRMVVQVHPTGWSARCVEHGTITG
jgi:GNAT superfamily N-acetyltransferase